MIEKTLGILFSTVCGALIGFILGYTLLGSGEPFYPLEPTRVQMGSFGAMLFAFGGLASGVVLSLTKGSLAHTTSTYALVGALGCMSALSIFGIQNGITSVQTLPMVLLSIISCLPGLAFYCASSIYRYFAN